MLLSLLVHTSRLLLLWLLSLSVSTVALASDWIDYPPEGTATLTHYTLPDGYVASCGCTGASTRYPTAAMSQFAYGSSNAYGPGCGRCFKITLLNSVTGTPLFYPEETKSIVIKVTDLCPGSGGAGWCSAKPGQPNQAGAYINFDLAYPSPAIPEDFFPSDEAFYAKTPMGQPWLNLFAKDFGVWNVTYQSVDCLENWAGARNAAALGSVDDGSSVCCPANPTGSPNDTCPSFSEANGIPPDTATSAGTAVLSVPNLGHTLLPLYSLFVLSILCSGFLLG
ncbi:RlpA-like double-psi beta-barrel-protein domain-containing protein-containing protein [Earliella scabrosa]|nr:RlpA-like double-psi beta-barrel-protein domain-containing protein-containing protein [Earliella scabrosa]